MSGSIGGRPARQPSSASRRQHHARSGCAGGPATFTSSRLAMTRRYCCLRQPCAAARSARRRPKVAARGSRPAAARDARLSARAAGVNGRQCGADWRVVAVDRPTCISAGARVAWQVVAALRSAPRQRRRVERGVRLRRRRGLPRTITGQRRRQAIDLHLKLSQVETNAWAGSLPRADSTNAMPVTVDELRRSVRFGTTSELLTPRTQSSFYAARHP